MDELMRKITEKLNIAIDKAPEVYEMLKWQHVIYDTVNYINTILYILLFTAGSVEVFFLMFAFDDFYDKKVNKRMILLSFIPFIVIILLIIILYIYRNINASDVLFLKEVLRG